MKTNVYTSPEELANHIGETIVLRGAVHKIRHMRGFAFVLLRGDREITQCVYGEGARFPLDALQEECCVALTGNVAEEPRSRTGYEIHIVDVDILSRPAAPMPIVINNRELPATLEHLLDYRPLTLRNAEERAIFKAQEGIARGFRAYCEREGMTEIHTPKLVRSGAEGGASMFELDYFGQTACLAQSPQLYKQMMAGVFGRVFEIGPVFRAENHDTSWHLNEYTSMDCELAYVGSLQELMMFQQRMMEHIMAELYGKYAPELEVLGAALPEVKEIPSLSFTDAKELLKIRYGFHPADMLDFEREEERLLGEHARREWESDFLFVTGYPSAKRPFYTRDKEDDPAFTESYDLLFRGVEITTGGLRIHDYEHQLGKIRSRGMDVEEFAPYLMIHKHGMPPHGGLGIGLERLTARLLGLDNLRRAALFPRDRGRLSP